MWLLSSLITRCNAFFSLNMWSIKLRVYACLSCRLEVLRLAGRALLRGRMCADLRSKVGWESLSWRNGTEATMLKLLWNLYGKSDSLWMKWISTYYIKHNTLMDVKTKTSYFWIMKVILQLRESIENLQCWEQMMHRRKFTTKVMYLALRDEEPKVNWRKLFYGNKVRLRSQMILWLVCHGKHKG